MIHVGSVPDHMVINHDQEVADQHLFDDYFIDNPQYDELIFRARFWMSRSLFIQIVDVVKDHDNYLKQ